MESLKGKLTEEEAKKLLEYIEYQWLNVRPPYNKYTVVAQEKTIEVWKEKGYVKENPIQKARRLHVEKATSGELLTQLELAWYQAFKYYGELKNNN